MLARRLPELSTLHTTQEAQARDTESKLRAENDALAAELRGLEAFTRAKADLEASQLRMRAENDALQAKLERADAEAERKYVYGTMTLKREYDQKVEELKKRCAARQGCLQQSRSDAELPRHRAARVTAAPTVHACMWCQVRIA